MKPLSLLLLLALLAGCTFPGFSRDVTGGDSLSARPPTSTSGLTPSLATPPPGAFPLAAPVAVSQPGSLQLHLLDLNSGGHVSGLSPLGLPAGTQISASVAAPDNSRLALVSGVGDSCQPYAGGSLCSPSVDTLHLVDMRLWQMLDLPLALVGYSPHLAFNPDASRLALAYTTRAGSILKVFDGSTARLLAQLRLGFEPQWLSFVLDGQAIAVYGVPPASQPGITMPGAPRLQLLDSENLQAGRGLRFDSMLSGDWCYENCAASPEQQVFTMWKPGLALSPDSTRLYIIHADQELLSGIDLEQGAVHDDPIQKAASWLERLVSIAAGVAYAGAPIQGAIKSAVVSPDGSRLYVLTTHFSPDSPDKESQTLQAIELSGGLVLAAVGLNPDRPVHGLQFDPRGKMLLLSGYSGNQPYLQAVSPQSLEPSASLSAWEIIVGPGVLLGQRALGASSELAVIDPQSFEVLRSWKMQNTAFWLDVP